MPMEMDAVPAPLRRDNRRPGERCAPRQGRSGAPRRAYVDTQAPRAYEAAARLRPKPNQGFERACQQEAKARYGPRAHSRYVSRLWAHPRAEDYSKPQ